MKAFVKQSGAALEVLEDQNPGASYDDHITHLHFDRRARAWRAHPAIAVEATTGIDEQGTRKLRSA